MRTQDASFDPTIRSREKKNMDMIGVRYKYLTSIILTFYSLCLIFTNIELVISDGIQIQLDTSFYDNLIKIIFRTIFGEYESRIRNIEIFGYFKVITGVGVGELFKSTLLY